MTQPLHSDDTISFEEVLEDAGERATQSTLPSVMIGRLVRLDHYSPPMVDFPANNTGDLVPARSTVALCQSHVGDEVTLVFEESDPSRPIILGVLQPWATMPAQPLEPVRQNASMISEQNPENLLLMAANEITLRCGKASITLTNAGKLLLRGAYLLSRSSGVNRIKGGSVQIN